MKSTALSTVLGVVALAGVGVVYLKLEDVSSKVDALANRRASSPRDMVAEADTPSQPSSRTPVQREGYQPVARQGGGDEGSTDSASQEPPRSMEERMSKMENDMKRMRSKNEGVRHFLPGRSRNYARSVDHLAKSLRLTPSQKDRVKDAVERGKKQIEDLLKLPDESGKSPYERREEQRKKIREAIQNKDHSGLVSFATDMYSYRNKPIPGRNATYGQEIDRIKGDTRNEIDATLSPEQQKQFENTSIDPLVGAQGGDGMVMAFTSHVSDGAEPDAEDVFVETRGVAIAEVPGGKDVEKPKSDKDDDD